MQGVLSFLSVVNKDYSGILSFLASLSILIVTAIYVAQTKKQVDATLLAVRKSSLPQLVIEYSDGYLTRAFTEWGRRQLSLNCSVMNYGKDPALSIYCFGEARLQNGKNSSQAIIANHDPVLIAGLQGGENAEFDIRFETDEIEAILKDLSITYDKNMRRIQENPYEKAFAGVVIAVKVVYANCFNELSYSELLIELVGLEMPSEGALEESRSCAFLTPLDQIELDQRYSLVTANPRLIPTFYGSITEEELKQLIVQREDQLLRICSDELGISALRS